METVSMSSNATACSHCGERDHSDTRCPELSAPVRQEGVQKPAGGPPRGGGDDDESAKKVESVIAPRCESQTQIRL